MHRLHVYTIGGIALLIGTLVLIVSQGVLQPVLPDDAAEQLTVIARTDRWEGLQRAALLAQPLLLMGFLGAAAAVTASGGRPWAWMGSGLTTYGVLTTTIAHTFFGGTGTFTRPLVSDAAPIDASLLTSYELMLPLASHAQHTGWIATGIGIALLGQGLLVSRMAASWLAMAVTILGAVGAVLALLMRDPGGFPLAAIAVLAAQILLAAALFMLPRSVEERVQVSAGAGVTG